MAADPLAGLDPQFAQAIQALIAASGGKLYIESGYRSVEEQQKLYDAAVAKYGEAGASKWVAPPGHSNHNRGLAVDLGGDIQLAHDLAPQFGLVFPMSWEPWHIEPVHARESSSDQAYTVPPPGERNPVHDQSLSTRPEYLAASLSDAMSAAQLAGTMGAGLGLAGGEVAPLGGGAQPTSSGTGGGGGASVGGPAGSQRGGAGSVDPAALYQALRSQGLDPVHAAAFVAVAGRESGYQAGAHNPNRATGDDSYGLFQVNLLGGQHSQYSPQMLTTLEGSAKAAAEMFKASGTNPWGPYKGASWLANTNGYWQTAADASGGEVTADQIAALQNEGLR